MAQGESITYRVTAISPDTQFGNQNAVVTGKRVSFETSTGYNGSVFVPDGVFSDRAAVARLIEGEVRIVAAAQSIAGQITG